MRQVGEHVHVSPGFQFGPRAFGQHLSQGLAGWHGDALGNCELNQSVLASPLHQRLQVLSTTCPGAATNRSDQGLLEPSTLRSIVSREHGLAVSYLAPAAVWQWSLALSQFVAIPPLGVARREIEYGGGAWLARDRACATAPEEALVDQVHDLGVDFKVELTSEQFCGAAG